MQVDPPQIQVHIPVTALSSLKTLPVLVTLSGQVKSGYQVTSLSVNPAQIDAQGPPYSLTGTNAVATVPVSLTGHKSTFSTRAALKLRRGLTSTTRSVTITVGVRALMVP